MTNLDGHSIILHSDWSVDPSRGSCIIRRRMLVDPTAVHTNPETLAGHFPSTPRLLSFSPRSLLLPLSPPNPIQALPIQSRSPAPLLLSPHQPRRRPTPGFSAGAAARSCRCVLGCPEQASGMPKGDDALARKRGKVRRKRMRSSENAVSTRVAAIIASKSCHKTGKRRGCEGASSLPLLVTGRPPSQVPVLTALPPFALGEYYSNPYAAACLARPRAVIDGPICSVS